MAPQPRLNLFKGNYGKISKDMQSIDWDTTLQGQPFTDAYRAFCNIYVDLQYDEISLTFTAGPVCLCGVSSPVVVLGLFVRLS